MPTNLTNSNISETYQGVLHANGELPPSGQAQIYDGVGNKSAITLGQEDGGITITGNLNVEGSINGNSITGNTINGGGFSKPQDIVDLIYPVGSVYISIDNVNPNAKFPGSVTTWVRVAKGKFIAGVGTGTDANGETKFIAEGDNDNGEYDVTLDASQMPSHNHYLSTPGNGQHTGRISETTYLHDQASFADLNYQAPNNANFEYILHGTDRVASSGLTSPKGGDQPHTNIPPYMGMYIWKRTI